MSNTIITTWRKPRFPWAEEVDMLFGHFYRTSHRTRIMVYSGGWQPILGKYDHAYDRAIWVRLVPRRLTVPSSRILFVSNAAMDAIGELTFEGKGFKFREGDFEYKVFDKCEMNPREWVHPREEDAEDGGALLEEDGHLSVS